MFIFLILLFCFAVYFTVNQIKNNKKSKLYELQKQIEDCEKFSETWNKTYESCHQKLEDIEKEIEEEIKNLEDKVKENEKQKNIIDSANDSIQTLKTMRKQVLTSYDETLEANYKTIEKDYENNLKLMKAGYEQQQDAYMREAGKVRLELDQIRNTRAAAIQASIKEKEISENKDFYCLKINDLDLNDIKILSNIKEKLNQPRILSMLIWGTYYQKEMTQLCNNIIGTVEKTGIYKITNQITNECYIGQSVKISDRWKNHAKAGLGIDTPKSNKLYAAMIEYGLHNFSWEILEECEKEYLDEKEKEYIAIYNSKDYGYNSTKGNSK